jgi:hypothetical protein
VAASAAVDERAAETATSKAATEEENKANFEPEKIRHKGQFALRKLYHESNRVLVAGASHSFTSHFNLSSFCHSKCTRNTP